MGWVAELGLHEINDLFWTPLPPKSRSNSLLTRLDVGFGLRQSKIFVPTLSFLTSRRQTQSSIFVWLTKGILMPTTRVVRIKWDETFTLSGPWKTLHKCLFMFSKHKSLSGTYPRGNESYPDGSPDWWSHLFAIILVATEVSPPQRVLPWSPTWKIPPLRHALYRNWSGQSSQFTWNPGVSWNARLSMLHPGRIGQTWKNQLL